MINGLLLKLHILSTAKYSTEDIFGKSKEDFQSELDELSVGDKVELLESFGDRVEENFEEGGRWTNYRIRVFRFWHEKEHVYVNITEEVPASESQDGTDLSEPSIDQVYPHKVETTVYKTTKQGAK